MSRKTSFDELYTTIGTVVNRSTGRPWWRKKGIQAQPSGPYALISLDAVTDFQNQVTENIQLIPPEDTGECFQQIPWNAGEVAVSVVFYRDTVSHKAEDAATRFRTALRLEERFWDLWEICGLVGGINLIDLSASFRADTESRIEVKFRVNANIADPPPLEDHLIYDIQSQEIDVIHHHLNDENTEIIVPVDSPYITTDDSSSS